MMEEICEKILEIRKNYYNGDKTWKWGKTIKDLMAEYAKKENIETFVKNESLGQFDFSNDCYNDKYMEENDCILKYLLYRVSNLKANTPYKNALTFKEKNEDKWSRSRIIDPDSESILLQILYQGLYGKDFCKNSLFINRENDRKNKNIQGDTMNTVQSVLNSYIEKCLEEKKYPFFKEEICKISKKDYFGYFLELFCQHEKDIREELEGINAPKLMKTYHTLGNFIIIPTGCNAPRGSCILKDFWDLTLACIYNWYSQKEKREDRIVKVIGGMPLEYNIGMIFAEESDIEKYVKWLNLFGTWEQFVKANYLDDRYGLDNFVSKDNVGNYGRPRELWPGHFEGKVMPTTNEEYSKFFTNSSEYIKNRGVIMHKELNSK